MKKFFLLFFFPTLLSADTALVFSEIMYHPATDEPQAEWLEFHNQLAVDIDVSEWSVTGGIQYTFPSNTIVRGGGYLVLAISPQALAVATGLTNSYGPYTGRLANNGESLELRDINGRVVDQISYGVEGEWPVGPDGSGVSLAKRDKETSSQPAANWTASDEVGGTPGGSNFPFVDEGAPRKRLVNLDSDWRVEGAGTDLGSGWQNLAFNDSAWTSGPTVQSSALVGLFNTGLDAGGNPVADGGADPHYTIAAAAQGPIGGQAVVIQNHPNWLANSASSKWIGVLNPGSGTVAVGAYHYQTTFSVGNAVPGTVRVSFEVAADDRLTDVLLNGNPAGFSAVGFAGFSSTFELASGFNPGLNTLQFRCLNDGTAANPAGFRNQIRGSALFANPAVLGPGPATHYFRQTFNWIGDPLNTELQLNAIVDDGAVFYLNGVEIHRVNLPAGPISFSTPASSDIATPVFTGPMTIPATGLVSGTNVLAVEVHQAAGGNNDVLLAAELIAITLPTQPITIAFNEISGATNAPFILELYNHGTTSYLLEGYVILLDGLVITEYVFPSGAPLDSDGYLSLTSAVLGFQPVAGDKLFLLPPSRHKVIDGGVVKGGARARDPAGTGPWLRPSSLTPGGANTFSFHDEIVINEIMYHHAVLAAAPEENRRESAEAWIELYNRSSNPVDLTGWELDEGIRYSFLQGTTLAPDSYLVVAGNAAQLQATYPGIAIVGDFAGNLSHGQDRIVLKDSAGNPADVVHYYDSGRWPGYADGGGSSLELRSPDADNSIAEAWAASDETGNSGWSNYTYRAVAQDPLGQSSPQVWNEFWLGLLGAGECLIDDLSVIQSPDSGPVQFVTNGDFESGLNGWRVLGTHNESRVIPDPDNGGNQVLHLVATGPQEHMHNHIETTHGRTVQNGTEFEISFRAKWLAGNRLLNTRLYFNRAARSSELAVPALNGTPGARNSRYETNIGPTLTEFKHSPILPAPSQPVNVSVRAADPDGVTGVQLWWSANGAVWVSSPMSDQGQGVYAASILGQPLGTVVQFYVQASDSTGVSATFPAAGPDSGALYEIQDGQADFSQGHNMRLIVTPSNTDLLHALTNVMSNARVPATLVYNEKRVYYDVGLRLKGSEHGRFNDTRVSFNISFQPDDLFRGVHPVMLIDRSGQGDSGDDKQEEILVRHMLLRAGGLPGPRPDLCRVIAPRAQHNDSAILSPRHEDEYIETAFPNGGDGRLYELELIYYQTSAQNGYKVPQSSPGVVNSQDFGDLGDDKEIYRYNFIKKNHRDVDDYSTFMNFAKGWELTGDALELYTRQTMDIDEWARAFAFLSLCGIGDMYNFSGNAHNLMMYVRPSDNKVLAFPWDMDFSFVNGTGSGLLGGSGRLVPILNRPAHFRCLAAHFLDLMDTVYNTAYMNAWIDHYDNFTPGQDFSDISGYISARSSSVRSQLASGSGIAFAVDGSNTINTDSNIVVLTGTAPYQAKTLLVNGQAYPITWTSTTAWQLRVPVSDSSTALQIVPHDVHNKPLTNLTQTVTVNYAGTPPAAEDHVVFNEIMYHPRIRDAAYLELHNTSPDFAFDLSGMVINGVDYTFPSGSVIFPGGYFLLAQDTPVFTAAYPNVPVQGRYNGNLDRGGETLTLFKPGATPDQDQVVDKVRYDDEMPWPATPDGQGPSLQLIDANADNSRVSNWSDGAGWRPFQFTGRIGGTRLFLFLNDAGELYMDNITVVTGAVAEVGINLVVNGDMEAPFEAPWSAGGNHSGTTRSTDVVFAGTGSMHIVSEGIGSGGAAVIQLLDGVDPGGTYTMSFWFLPNTSGPTRLTARFGSTFRPEVDITPVLFTPGAENSVTGTGPGYPDVWLNEVQPNNTIGITDNAGDRDAWIELYNHGPTPIDLSNYSLANNYSNLVQWAFPPGATLQPNEFMVVWADAEPGESIPGEHHANFTLPSGFGSVVLSRNLNGALQLVDYLNYETVGAALSYGDFPDAQPFHRQVMLVPTPGTTNVARRVTLFLNEWLALNSTIADPADGDFDDWFEIYNPTPEPVDLGGFYLTDDLLNKNKFRVPPGYTVPANGFLLVWADEESSQNQSNRIDLHLNFRLGSSGEVLGLYTPELLTLDEVVFTNQTANVSEGRFPDGAANIVAMSGPTPRGPNSLAGANLPPTLSPIPNQTVLLGATLTLNAVATDPDVPAQILTFSLDPGAPAGAGVHPSSGLFSWTPLPDQAPGVHSITLRVTDDGVSPRSGTATFTVEVIAGPPVSIVFSGPNLSLSFPAITGKTYRVEFKNSLNDLVWTPLSTDTAVGNSLTVMDIIGANAQRFYRIVELD